MTGILTMDDNDDDSNGLEWYKAWLMMTLLPNYARPSTFPHVGNALDWVLAVHNRHRLKE